MQNPNNARLLVGQVLVIVLSVLIGLILPTFISGFFKFNPTELTSRDVIVIFILVILAGLCIYILKMIQDTNADVKKELSDLVSKIDDFEFAQDFEQDWEKGKYNGRVFKKLRRLVEEAELSIDAISLSSIAHKDFFKGALYDREAYFNEIVEKVASKQEAGKSFTYRRVFQVSQEEGGRIPDIMFDHRDKIERLNGGSIQAYVKQQRLLRMSGVVIIDKKTLAFVISGIAETNGQHYPVALLVFKKGIYSELVTSYATYFESVYNNRGYQDLNS